MRTARARPAACGAGCRAGTRAGSCPCRSSDDTRGARCVPAAADSSARAAPASRPSASDRCVNTPSRSLTLSAPNTRIGIVMPAVAERHAFLDVRAGQHRRARRLERAADRRRAVTVGVGFDDGDDAGRRGCRPASRLRVEQRREWRARLACNRVRGSRSRRSAGLVIIDPLTYAW